MRLLTLALLVPLVGCASSAAVPNNPITVPPLVTPQSLSEDAASCGIALALAGVTGGTAAIGAAVLSTPSCARLPGDVIARLQGDATVKATAARRQLRLRP